MKERRSSPEPQRDVPPSPSTNPFFLPSGFRFVPTQEELILDYLIPYLRRDRSKHSWPTPPVHHVNIYESNPEQLTEKFEMGNNKKEWFFISQRTKRHEGGKKQKRSDNAGYWHATDGAKKIDLGQDDLVGYKTSFVYYVGKPPNSVKSNWLMTEYSTFDEKANHALYKIYLSPLGVKKRRLEEEENRKKKKKIEEGVAAVNLEEKIDQPHFPEYQHPQQGTIILPPPHGQDSRSGTTTQMSSQERSLDMWDDGYFDNMKPMSSEEDDKYFDIGELLNDLDNSKDDF